MRRILFFLVVLLPRAADAQSGYPLSQYMSAQMAIAPTISPDGKQVAFASDITGVLQLWRVSSSGGWPHQLTYFPSGIAEGPQWSPVDNEILVSADNGGDQQYQLYLVRSDGFRITPLAPHPKVRYRMGGWSRDGKSIFYASNARDERYYDCYVMDVATRKERRVFRKDAVMRARALSGDGRTLAAIDTHSEVNSDVYLVDVATGKGRLLTLHTGDAKYDAIGFTPDGRRLYVTSDQGREFVNLAWIDTTTGKLTFERNDKADVGGGLLSRDGRSLAFTRNLEGFEELASLRNIATPAACGVRWNSSLYRRIVPPAQGVVGKAIGKDPSDAPPAPRLTHPAHYAPLGGFVVHGVQLR